MNFKKLKSKLLNEKKNKKGTGFVRLSHRLNEAQFPWHKFPAKPPDDAGLPIGKKGEKHVDKPDSILRGMVPGGNDSGKKQQMDYNKLKSSNPRLAAGLEDALEALSNEHGINYNPESAEITKVGEDKWMAEIPAGNGYERFYVHPDLKHSGLAKDAWSYEEDVDDRIFDDFD